MLRIRTLAGASMAKGRTGPRDFARPPMASTPPARLKRDALSGSEGRHLPLHILFLHSHAVEVERCLQELDKVISQLARR